MALICFVIVANLLDVFGFYVYRNKADWDAMKSFSASWLSQSLHDPHPHSTRFLSDPQTSPCDLGQVT